MKKLSYNKLKKILNEIDLLFKIKDYQNSFQQLSDLLIHFPKHPEILNRLAQINLIKSEFVDAINLMQQSLNVNPYQFNILNDMGLAFRNIGDNSKAIECLDKSIQINPNYFEAFFNRALIKKNIGLCREAISDYSNAIRVQPHNLVSRLNQANVYLELGEYEVGLNIISDLIRNGISTPEIFYNQGIFYQKLNENEKALLCFDKAIELNDKYVEAYINKAIALQDLNKITDAISLLEFVISKESTDSSMINKKKIPSQNALTLDNSKQNDNELTNLNHKAKFNLALMYLYIKKFDVAWELYESRWLTPHQIGVHYKTHKPELSDINHCINKTLLIWGEQGIGDQILYFSMIDDFSGLNIKLIVAIDKRLIPFLQRNHDSINFVALEDNVSEESFDYHISISSLGKFFRKSIEDFGKQKSYLYADKIKFSELRNQLKGKGKIICGLSWKSSNDKFGKDKSINLIDLKDILSNPNFIFINIQYGDVKNEIEEIKKHLKIDIKIFNEIDIYNDIDGLASIIDMCDLIISTSNVNVHIAGALGKKTCLIHKNYSKNIWYWHENDSVSMWYPSVSIYRQGSFLTLNAFLDDI